MAPSNTVDQIVAERLCCGCGTCVAACPARALAIGENPAGYVVPKVDSAACTRCGLCLDVCPGKHYLFELPGRLDDLLRPSPRAVFLARSLDPEISRAGQSGGIATAILAYLMRRGGIAHALVARPDRTHRPRPFWATTRAEVIDCAGSLYAQCPAIAAVAEAPPGPSAVVGLPCHMHGLANLASRRPKLVSEAAFRVGLLCHMSCSSLGLDPMLRACGADPTRIWYRHRSGETARGVPAALLPDGSLRTFEPAFLGRMFSETIASPRCMLCFDKMNRLADVALGDPNGFPHEIGRGRSVAIAYTERGASVLSEMAADSAIELTECSFDDVCRGQNLMTRRRGRLLAAYSRWRGLGRAVPALSALDGPMPKARLPHRVLLAHLWRLWAAPTREAAAAAVRRHERLWGPVLKVLRKLGAAGRDGS
jgi:coenzyme F420 hydrogenase subunit beta